MPLCEIKLRKLTKEDQVGLLVRDSGDAAEDPNVNDNVHLVVSPGDNVFGKGTQFFERVDANGEPVDLPERHILLSASEEGDLTLTSLSDQPCYYQPRDCTQPSSLSKLESAGLHSGDKFYLYADDPGYLLEIKDNHENMSPSKRKFPKWMDDEDENDDAAPKAPGEAAAVHNLSDAEEEEEQQRDEAAGDEESVEPDQEDEDEEVPPDQQSADVSASTSQQTAASAARPSCRYAQSCYRKNPQHKADFSHPGDPDFVSAPTTAPPGPAGPAGTATKPLCPYGTSCYRKNPTHKQNYDHSQPPTASPAQQKRDRKAKRAKQTSPKKKATPGSGSESDDSYESSFIDDSSSDYTPGDEDDSDEDWEQ